MMSLFYKTAYQHTTDAAMAEGGHGGKHVNTGEETAAERRGSLQRKLTMKYDIHALNFLQHYEETLGPELAKLYNVPEDDLAVELDLLHVFNAPADTREVLLMEQIKNPPSDAAPLIAQIIARLAELQKECDERNHESK